MPIYEYICEDCGREMSVFTRSISTPVTEPACGDCDGGSVRRKISRVAVVRSPQETFRDYDRMSWVDDAPGDDDYDGFDDDGFDDDGYG